MTNREREVYAALQQSIRDYLDEHETAIDIDDASAAIVRYLPKIDYDALAYYVVRRKLGDAMRDLGMNRVARYDADGNVASVYYNLKQPEQISLLTVEELRATAENKKRQGATMVRDAEREQTVCDVAIARGASPTDNIGDYLNQAEIAEIIDCGYIDKAAS